MADFALLARPRSERGRHAKALRRRGTIPAVLYGHKLEPVAVETEAKELARVWRRAGRTHLVDLSVDGREHKVLIRDLQFDPRTAHLLHADFFAVNLREKTIVDVPIVTVGESPAVTVMKVGQVLQTLSSVRVECLPTDIPGQLSVDISGLTEIDQALTLGDIALPQGVAFVHADLQDVVVKIAPVRVSQEAEAAPPAEGLAEVAGAEGAAEGGAEG